VPIGPLEVLVSRLTSWRAQEGLQDVFE
jgi:hypothetical protein